MLSKMSGGNNKPPPGGLEAMIQKLIAGFSGIAFGSQSLPQDFQEIIRAAFGQIPLIIWVVDSEGIIRLTEGGGLKGFGLAPAALVGKCHYEIYKDRPDLVADVKRALAGETFRVDQRMDPHFFEVFFAPIHNSAGEVTHMVGVTIDITERKRLETELHEAIEVRDMFFSIASHELKTPLSALKLQLQIQMRMMAKGKTQESYARLPGFLQSMDRQLTQLTRLVDDMLDISRIKTGGLRIQPEPTDLSEVIARAVDRLLPQFQEAGQSLHAEIQPGIFGKVDGFRIEQVINNLLVNALRYAPKSPVRVCLKNVVEHTAEILIQDRGPGISAEDQGRIFSQFERGVAAAKSSPAGLGLGLFITRTIVEAHGGSIKLDSTLNRGTSFVITLPLSAG